MEEEGGTPPCAQHASARSMAVLLFEFVLWLSSRPARATLYMPIFNCRNAAVKGNPAPAVTGRPFPR